MRKILFTGITFMLFICSTFSALADDHYRTEEVTFNNGDSVLAGTLALPKGAGPYPAIVFIHGDGPATRDSSGLLPLFGEEFTCHGFACLVYDKPGVGESKGNWLTQSMHDRAVEALAAIDFLQARGDIQPDMIGFWGGSQAGWVMPMAVSMSKDVAFIISVSGPISWEKQGDYMRIRRLQREGFSEDEIQEALACSKEDNSFIRKASSLAEYKELEKTLPEKCAVYSAHPLETDRWRFVKLNIDSDARSALRQTRCPVLAIFGDKDVHVDVYESMEVYKEELAAAGNTDVTIRLFPNADHALIESEYSLPVSLCSELKVEFFGKDAFVPGYFETMTQWLDERVKN